MTKSLVPSKDFKRWSEMTLNKEKKREDRVRMNHYRYIDVLHWYYILYIILYLLMAEIAIQSYA